MRIEERFEVQRPREAVFSEFANVPEIGRQIAGVEDVQVVTDDESLWRIAISAGFMAITTELEARVTERIAPERISFVATGQNVNLAGTVEFEATGVGSTMCDIVIDLEPRGPLAPLMEQLGRGPQQQLAQRTIANLRQKLSADGDPPPPLDADPSERRGAVSAGMPGPTRLVVNPRSIAPLGGGILVVLIAYLLGRARGRRAAHRY